MGYGISKAVYNKEIRMVENEFTKRITILSKQAAKNNKMLSMGVDEGQEGIVIDISGLPSLREGYEDLESDIASYRQEMIRIPEINTNFLKEAENRKILFIDYILAVSLCRVEIIERATGHVNSFYATRNIKIAAGVTGESENELKKHTTFLSSKYTDYMYKDLKILRMSSRKKGFVINNPEAHLIYDETKEIKVIPVAFINNYVDGLLDSLSKTVQKITHKTDIGTLEDVVTTLNKGVLQKVYTNEDIAKKFKHSGYIEQESIMTLPDLETSKYSEKGVQSINITRITKVEPKNSIDTRYREIDFENVLMEMVLVVESTSRENITEIYNDLEIGQSEIYMEQKRMINTYINNKYSHEGERYIKKLHDYMISKPGIFEGYTGKQK